METGAEPSGAALLPEPQSEEPEPENLRALGAAVPSRAAPRRAARGPLCVFTADLDLMSYN